MIVNRKHFAFIEIIQRRRGVLRLSILLRFKHEGRQLKCLHSQALMQETQDILYQWVANRPLIEKLHSYTGFCILPILLVCI